MNTKQIIQQLDSQIQALQKARTALAELNGTGTVSTGNGRRKRRKTMSAEARAKIGAAMKARWAAKRKK